LTTTGRTQMTPWRNVWDRSAAVGQVRRSLAMETVMQFHLFWCLTRNKHVHGQVASATCQYRRCLYNCSARYESDATRRSPRGERRVALYVALRAARRAFSSYTLVYLWLNARWRTEPLSTTPKVEPVSTLGAVESGSIRHRALCERNIRNPCFRLWARSCSPRVQPLGWPRAVWSRL